jgi:hypothetical protein
VWESRNTTAARHGWLRRRVAGNWALNSRTEKGVAMRKLFEYGGIAASIVLIAFGIGSIAVGA